MIAEVLEYFRNGVSRLSVKGRMSLYLYTAAIGVCVFLDSIGTYLISRSIALWFQNLNEQNSPDLIPMLSLGLGATVLRGIVFTLVSYFVMNSLIRDEARISKENYDLYQSQNLTDRKNINIGEMNALIQQCPEVLIQTVVLNSISAVGQILNIITVALIVCFVDLRVGIGTILFFALLAILQHRYLSVRSMNVGERRVNAFSGLYQIISVSKSMSKLLSVMPSTSLRNEVEARYRRVAKSLVDTKVIQLLPRVTLEFSVVFGSLLILAIGALSGDQDVGVRDVVLFIFISFRLTPMLSYVQSLLSTVITDSQYLRVVDAIPFVNKLTKTETFENADHRSESGVSKELMKLLSVSYSYPNSGLAAISDLTYTFEKNKIYAIVGETGSGKSTVADICMGLIKPTSGQIVWDEDLDIGYVPQHTVVFPGSFAQNISLEWSDSCIDESRLDAVITIADNLKIFQGLDVFCSDPSLMSGGQQQVICLLRAIYRKPHLYVLDEVTSSLDNLTEEAVTSIINSLRRSSTVIIIAHRLSTVRQADDVLYLSNGRLVGNGSFEYLRVAHPEFERTVQLAQIEDLDGELIARKE